MKKTTLLLLAFAISFISFGQEFIGIKIAGNKEDVINKFKAKGFVLQKKHLDDVTPMIGSIAGKIIEINIVNTPISKKVWRLAVYLPKQSSWYTLKSQYYEYLNFLTQKYGEPVTSIEDFTSPYFDGDGYEMSAVSLDKCEYKSTWDNVSINISKFHQVRITYDNIENSLLDDQERNKVNQTIF